MSAGLARNWWAIGLRGVAAVLLSLGVLLLPQTVIASLVLLFAAYLAADGLFALIAGRRAARRGEYWWSLIIEGLTNLAVAGGILVWQVAMAWPFIYLTSAWAVVTGALLLAAARRLAGTHGRAILTLAGAISCAWGIVVAAAAAASVDTYLSTRLWLLAYALPFGVILLVLAFHLRRRHRETQLDSVGLQSKPQGGRR
jgi:uncharacterized membrane protein HdeD (DUF308 family)